MVATVKPDPWLSLEEQSVLYSGDAQARSRLAWAAHDLAAEWLRSSLPPLGCDGVFRVTVSELVAQVRLFASARRRGWLWDCSSVSGEMVSQ